MTPPGLVFAVRASRFVTHDNRLDEAEQTATSFIDRIRCLGSKLGPVLLHLPSCYPFNGDRLDAFYEVLNKDFRYAFVFRDPDWFRRLTCDIFYTVGWAEKILHWIKEGRAVYIYFDNTMERDAVNDALKLSEMLSRELNPEGLL